MKRYLTLSTLLLLIGFKFFTVIFESKSPSLANVLPAIMYAAMFGSPQIFWFFKNLALEQSEARQQTDIATVTFVFVLLAAYFGSFPGTSPPSWSGGQAHFELPAALLAEWFIALLALVPFRQAKNPSQ